MEKIKNGLFIRQLDRDIMNQHENLEFPHKLSKGQVFILERPKGKIVGVKAYNITTENLKYIITYCIDNNIKVRAIGSNWSMTKVGMANDMLIETSRLNQVFRIKNEHLDVTARAKHESSQLLMFQCGFYIRDINQLAEQEDLSLSTSGSSNGQTIVGAISTGTNGSAFNFGSLHDSILCIHLVCGPSKSVFIQREGDKVINEDFARKFNSELISDDDTFNAVLVSFGSMGIIHSVIIKLEPLFLLEKNRVRMSLSDTLKETITSLNFDSLNIPKSNFNKNLIPYHFDLVVNPYKLRNKGIITTVMYKIPYDSTLHERKSLKDREFKFGDQLLGAVNKLIEALPLFKKAAISLIVEQILNSQFSKDDIYPWYNTIGETFTYTSTTGQAASMAMGVNLSDTYNVIELLEELINSGSIFPGIYGIRFVKGTPALLGYSKFDITTVFELDGPDGVTIRNFYESLWNKMNVKGIEFTLHWGKINSYLNKERVEKMYGLEKIALWKSIRASLLETSMCKEIFTNNFMIQCGLESEFQFEIEENNSDPVIV